jgi:hypothetical protein
LTDELLRSTLIRNDLQQQKGGSDGVKSFASNNSQDHGYHTYFENDCPKENAGTPPPTDTTDEIIFESSDLPVAVGSCTKQ